MTLCDFILGSPPILVIIGLWIHHQREMRKID